MLISSDICRFSLQFYWLASTLCYQVDKRKTTLVSDAQKMNLLSTQLRAVNMVLALWTQIISVNLLRRTDEFWPQWWDSYIFLRLGLKFLEQAVEQHHRAAEEGRQLWESCPWLKERSARAGYSEIFPVMFWISPQHLSTTCSTTLTIKRCFAIIKQNFLCFNLCPLFLATGQHSEPPLPLFFVLPFSCFHARTRSFWAFSSLC